MNTYRQYDVSGILESKYYTRSEIAEIFDVSVSLVSKWADSGLAGQTEGLRLKIHYGGDVVEFLKGHYGDNVVDTREVEMEEAKRALELSLKSFKLSLAEKRQERLKSTIRIQEIAIMFLITALSIYMAFSLVELL